MFYAHFGCLWWESLPQGKSQHGCRWLCAKPRIQPPAICILGLFRLLNSMALIIVIIDEYNPYCSKWGYCTWTPSFGDTGPPQSKGAVEDGTRGQCREDKDCTPWAPSCSPLGYCRGGVQVLD